MGHTNNKKAAPPTKTKTPSSTSSTTHLPHVTPPPTGPGTPASVAISTHPPVKPTGQGTHSTTTKYQLFPPSYADMAKAAPRVKPAGSAGAPTHPKSAAPPSQPQPRGMEQTLGDIREELLENGEWQRATAGTARGRAQRGLWEFLMDPPALPVIPGAALNTRASVLLDPREAFVVATPHTVTPSDLPLLDPPALLGLTTLGLNVEQRVLQPNSAHLLAYLPTSIPIPLPLGVELLTRLLRHPAVTSLTLAMDAPLGASTNALAYWMHCAWMPLVRPYLVRIEVAPHFGQEDQTRPITLMTLRAAPTIPRGHRHPPFEVVDAPGSAPTLSEGWQALEKGVTGRQVLVECTPPTRQYLEEHHRVVFVPLWPSKVCPTIGEQVWVAHIPSDAAAQALQDRQQELDSMDASKVHPTSAPTGKGVSLEAAFLADRPLMAMSSWQFTRAPLLQLCPPPKLLGSLGKGGRASARATPATFAQRLAQCQRVVAAAVDKGLPVTGSLPMFGGRVLVAVDDPGHTAVATLAAEGWVIYLGNGNLHPSKAPPPMADRLAPPKVTHQYRMEAGPFPPLPPLVVASLLTLWLRVEVDPHSVGHRRKDGIPWVVWSMQEPLHGGISHLSPPLTVLGPARLVFLDHQPPTDAGVSEEEWFSTRAALFQTPLPQMPPPTLPTEKVHSFGKHLKVHLDDGAPDTPIVATGNWPCPPQTLWNAQQEATRLLETKGCQMDDGGVAVSVGPTPVRISGCGQVTPGDAPVVEWGAPLQDCIQSVFGRHDLPVILCRGPLPLAQTDPSMGQMVLLSFMGTSTVVARAGERLWRVPMAGKGVAVVIKTPMAVRVRSTLPQQQGAGLYACVFVPPLPPDPGMATSPQQGGKVRPRSDGALPPAKHYTTATSHSNLPLPEVDDPMT